MVWNTLNSFINTTQRCRLQCLSISRQFKKMACLWCFCFGNKLIRVEKYIKYCMTRKFNWENNPGLNLSFYWIKLSRIERKILSSGMRKTYTFSLSKLNWKHCDQKKKCSLKFIHGHSLIILYGCTSVSFSLLLPSYKIFYFPLFLVGFFCFFLLLFRW